MRRSEQQEIRNIADFLRRFLTYQKFLYRIIYRFEGMTIMRRKYSKYSSLNKIIQHARE